MEANSAMRKNYKWYGYFYSKTKGHLKIDQIMSRKIFIHWVNSACILVISKPNLSWDLCGNYVLWMGILWT